MCILAEISAFGDVIERHIGAVTFVIAIGTIGLAIFALLQWRDGRKSSERQLRAYVLMESATIRIEGGIPRAKIALTNFGQTPAYKFYVGFEPLVFIEFSKADTLSTATRKKQFDGSRECLGPKDKRGIQIDDGGLVLDTAKHQLLVDGTHAIFAYGVVFYEDAFGIERHATIRVFIGGPVKLNTLPSMTAHNRGNDAD